MPMKTTTKPVNLALQGGGAHGAFSWGLLNAFIADERITIEGLSSTSAGTMNAVAYAAGFAENGRQGAHDKLNELWSRIAKAGQFFSPVHQNPLEKMVNYFTPGGSKWNMNHSSSYQLFEALTRLYSPYQFNPLNINPLRDLLESIIDFDLLPKCDDCEGGVKLFISATNVRTSKVKVFYNNEINLDVAMASACLPYLFQAVQIEGEYYWDGGYMGNPALYPFFYHTQSRDVIVLHINPIERDEVPTEALDITNRINEVSFNTSLMKEFRAIAFVLKLLEEDWLKDEHKDKLKHVLMHSIRADQVLCDLSVASKFNTDWSFLINLRDRGFESGKAWLDENYDKIGVEATVDLRTEFLER